MPGLTASLDASPFPKGRIEEGFSLLATQQTSTLPSHASRLDSFGRFFYIPAILGGLLALSSTKRN